MEVGSGRDMYGMTAITRITPKMVAGTHGEGPASAAASLDDDIAIITLDSWAHHLKLQSMTNEDTRPKTTEFQREDREWWETNKLVHKLEISWRIPKESKQSKVRQDHYCSTQKQKENSINILAIQHTFTRIFNYTEKLSCDSSKSLSLHTLQTKKLCNSPPPKTTRSLTLPLSCPLWWQVQTGVGAGIRNCTPRPLRVSILGIKFDKPSSPKNKIPGLIYTRGEWNNQIPGYYTPPWLLSRTQIPGCCIWFWFSNFFWIFFVFSNKNKHVWFWKNIMLFFFFFFELQLLNSRASCCFCTLVFYFILL